MSAQPVVDVTPLFPDMVYAEARRDGDRVTVKLFPAEDRPCQEITLVLSQMYNTLELLRKAG